MNQYLILLFLAALLPGRSNAGGVWTPLSSAPPVGVNNCMLLSDGSVLGMNGAGQCVKLSPDSQGSYINGTWTSLSTMNDSRLFFSSVMLTNGNVYVAGGEYGNAHGYAELYDPLANTWSIIQSGFFCSDACAMMLPNGNVLQSDSQSGYWIYDAAANRINYSGPCGDMNETCWVRLPNDSVLGLTGYSVTSEHYVPSAQAWFADNNAPVPLFGYGGELGAAFALPNGYAFQIGGTTNTALYTPGSSLTSPGTWVAGPGMPSNLGAVDAPAAMLVNGRILCAIGPVSGFNGPCYFYEYDYLANAFTQVNAPGGGMTYGGSAPFGTSMLDLPDGSVLFVGGQNSGALYIYTPTNSAPLAVGQPFITSIVENANGSYHLTGTNLAGLSRGAAYGDDEQMDGNYPLVRLTNNGNGNVYYARTYGWNSTTIQNAHEMTAEFVLPQTLPAGTYSLVVTAVGNPSAPQTFVYAPPAIPSGLTAASGSNAFVNLSWNSSGGATAYNLKRSLGSAGYFATIATLSATNYSDTGLTNGIPYYYKVAAVGAGGPSSDSAAVNAAPFGPPPIPTGLTADPDTFERIDLAWNASFGATNYHVQRSNVHNGPYTTVASTANLSDVDDRLTSGVTYFYVVSAANDEGESAPSAEVSVTAQAIGNFGFETPSLGSGHYQYALPGGTWSFSSSPGSGSGILANGSAFSSPNAPEGAQAAFLQGHGVISQVLSGFVPGTTYTITYSAAQRPGYSETWDVAIDGLVIKSNSAGSGSYTTYTAAFTATALTHTLFFVGTDLANNQDTVFIDNVRISPSLSSTVALPVLTQNTLPATAATVVGDSVTFAAAFGSVPSARYQWQFLNGAGVANDIAGATNSTLTLRNLQLSSSGFYRLKAVNATNNQGVVFSGTSPLTVSSVPGAVNNVITSFAAQTGYGNQPTNFAPTWTVPPGSLIAGQAPSSLGTGNFSLYGTGLPAVLTDGAVGDLNFWPGTGSSPTEVTCGPNAGQSVTYTLAGPAGGYVLSNIVVYGGWGDAGRDQQAYTVFYSTVSAPNSFIALGTVNYNPVNAAAVQSATRATLTPVNGVLASNVASVKFDFSSPAGENGFSGYSEIDLYGGSIIPVVTMNTLPATAADVVGSQVTFEADISGVNLAYQWQKIGGGATNDIPGATNAVLTLDNLTSLDAASYQLRGSNAYGAAVSAPAALTVNPLPAAVNNVIAKLAAQTGLGPSDAFNSPFTPTWTVATQDSLIAGQPPSTALGNFSEEISGRNVRSLTAGGDLSLTVVNGPAGITTSPNYVTCGNGGGAGSSLIYALTGSSGGYTLTNITVYGGWGDAGRDQQAYTVYTSSVESPAVFKLLGNVNFNPSNPANVQSATRATLVPSAGVLATNVAAVKFDFTTPASENGYVGYSQILLFGTPSSGLATYPTNIMFAVTGKTVTLSWPGDHTGWRLQAQTNSLSQGLGATWSDVAGSTLTNQLTVPTSPDNPSVFYRLVYP